jgi:hypothetical protein
VAGVQQAPSFAVIIGGSAVIVACGVSGLSSLMV